MSESHQTDSPYLRLPAERIRQGDILRDINFIFEWKPESDEPDKYSIKKYEYTYIVVLSQDCDLAQDSANRGDLDDKNQDGYIPSILVCPAYTKDDFKNGNQLTGYDLKMEERKGKIWDWIKSNREPRFHRLMPDPNYQVQEVVLDFKHFFTLPNKFMNELYNEHYNIHYLVSIKPLFREFLSQRFCNYICRVGTPEIKKTQ